jgi:hypothetical protein
MLRVILKIMFNKYVWLVFLPLLFAWGILMSRVQHRTNFARYEQLESVKQIWGTPLEQPMPSIRYKTVGSDVATLTRGDIAAAAITIKLDMDYRKKGLAYYTGYNTDFSGIYSVRNPHKEKIYLSFIFPYPIQQGEGLLRDVKLLLNEQEDVANTEYQPALALWTGTLEPEQEVTFTMLYHAPGLNSFIYGFEPEAQINQSRLAIHVQGARNVDYPEDTMTPTNIENTPNGVTLTWELDRSLTKRNIGVVLPDKLNVSQQISVMTTRAPAFFALFLFSVLIILKLIGKAGNFAKIAVISAAYFLFYPLFAYLAMYMHVWLAFGLSFGILGLLMFNYIRIVDNLQTALAVTLAYTFYSGITSLAALFPLYTGLILVIEAVVLLAIVMQVLARYRDANLLELLGLTSWFVVKPKPVKVKPTPPVPPPPMPPTEEQQG